MIFSPDIGRFERHLSISVFSHTLNYSDGLFEGMSLVIKDRVSLFHPELNYERMQYGAEVLNYDYKIDTIKAINTVFYLYLMNNINSKRVYVRPLLYMDNNSVSLRAREEYKLMHYLMPMGEYIEKDGLKVITSNITRELPFARLKVVSNYQLSKYALRTMPKGFDEVVFLDRNGKIIEGSGENIVFIKDNTLYTDRQNSLPGITLRFVIAIAKQLGVDVKYDSFRPDELDDVMMFMTGNAIGVKAVSEVYHNGKSYVIDGDRDIFNKIKTEYEKIFYGQDEQYHMFLDEFIDIDKYRQGKIDLNNKPERYEKVVKENLEYLGIKRFR